MTNHDFMAAMRVGIAPLPAPVALACPTCDHVNHYVCEPCQAAEDDHDQHQENR